eukprot:TRINITY_DN10222_c0_g1_i8.p1 TRINITY_DN10222_c0_g1~~TRINITY_DN10222_c0_g1_i8.p1  ORF type:complete len:1487 (-),score=246.06 TRINITY_DN10222_c0_g1_i8:68-4528(-)
MAACVAAAAAVACRKSKQGRLSKTSTSAKLPSWRLEPQTESFGGASYEVRDLGKNNEMCQTDSYEGFTLHERSLTTVQRHVNFVTAEWYAVGMILALHISVMLASEELIRQVFLQMPANEFGLDSVVFFVFLADFGFRAAYFQVGLLGDGLWPAALTDTIELVLAGSWILNSIVQTVASGFAIAVIFQSFSRSLCIVRALRLKQAFLSLRVDAVQKPYFRNFMGTVIVVNGLEMGLEADFRWSGFECLQQAIFCSFIMEFALNIRLFGITFFLPSHDGWGWSWLDAVIIACGAVDNWVIKLLPTDATGGPAAGSIALNLDFISFLRAIRLVKVVRELYRLAKSILVSSQGMLWVVILAVMVLYAFAILFTTIIGKPLLTHVDILGDDVDLHKTLHLFMTVPESMFTLFEAMNGTDDDLWPIFNSWAWIKIYYVVFKIVTSWVIMAIMAAVFCETMTVQNRAQQLEDEQGKLKREREESKAELLRLMSLVDADNNGTISRDEIQKFCDSKIFEDSLGISSVDVQDVFSMLVFTHGTVTSNALLNGVMDFVCGDIFGRQATETQLGRVERKLLTVEADLYDIRCMLSLSAAGIENGEPIGRRRGSLPLSKGVDKVKRLSYHSGVVVAKVPEQRWCSRLSPREDTQVSSLAEDNLHSPLIQAAEQNSIDIVAASELDLKARRVSDTTTVSAAVDLMAHGPLKASEACVVADITAADVTASHDLGASHDLASVNFPEPCVSESSETGTAFDPKSRFVSDVSETATIIDLKSCRASEAASEASAAPVNCAPQGRAAPHLTTSPQPWVVPLHLAPSPLTKLWPCPVERAAIQAAEERLRQRLLGGALQRERAQANKPRQRDANEKSRSPSRLAEKATTRCSEERGCGQVMHEKDAVAKGSPLLAGSPKPNFHSLLQDISLQSKADPAAPVDQDSTAISSFPSQTPAPAQAPSSMPVSFGGRRLRSMERDGHANGSSSRSPLLRKGRSGSLVDSSSRVSSPLATSRTASSRTASATRHSAAVAFATASLAAAPRSIVSPAALVGASTVASTLSSSAAATSGNGGFRGQSRSRGAVGGLGASASSKSATVVSGNGHERGRSTAVGGGSCGSAASSSLLTATPRGDCLRVRPAGDGACSYNRAFAMSEISSSKNAPRWGGGVYGCSQSGCEGADGAGVASGLSSSSSPAKKVPRDVACHGPPISECGVAAPATPWLSSTVTARVEKGIGEPLRSKRSTAASPRADGAGTAFATSSPSSIAEKAPSDIGGHDFSTGGCGSAVTTPLLSSSSATARMDKHIWGSSAKQRSTTTSPTENGAFHASSSSCRVKVPSGGSRHDVSDGNCGVAATALLLSSSTSTARKDKGIGGPPPTQHFTRCSNGGGATFAASSSSPAKKAPSGVGVHDFGAGGGGVVAASPLLSSSTATARIDRGIGAPASKQRLTDTSPSPSVKNEHSKKASPSRAGTSGSSLDSTTTVGGKNSKFITRGSPMNMSH